MTYLNPLGQRELCIYAYLSVSFWPNHENDRQQPPNFSSHFLHTYTYTTLQKITCISLIKNSQKKHANLDGRQLYNFDYRKLAIIPLDGGFVHANIYKPYRIRTGELV